MFVAFALSLLASPIAHAQGAELPPLMSRTPTLSEGVYGVGVGLGVGDPTGFNVALRTESLHTLSMLAGWNLSAGRFHTHSDYQLPFAEILPAESILAVTFYSGLGATLDIDQSIRLGARVPLVTALSFDKPVEVFIELAPVVGILPDVEFGVQATTGIRGWFKPKSSKGDGFEVGSE
tara:strand:+ start:656 stop:1189 length:534 start_codon:yes stop_codon:yes gene_type:complete